MIKFNTKSPEEYRVYLETNLKQAQYEFEEAKASAVKDLQDMDPYHAQDWGAAYYTKIDKITAAGTKVMQWHLALEAYEDFQKGGKK